MADPHGRTRLVLVRHAETPWNAEGRWQGHTDIGLSELGRRQAVVTARHLASAFPDACLIARSDSLRAAETSEPLERLLDVPVVVDERLREIDVGAWGGLTSAEVEVLHPESYAAFRAGEQIAIGGGETVADLRRRMLAALDDVAGKVGDGVGIVVTHGWALRVAVAGLLGRADELERVTNCSVTVVDLDRAGAQVVGYGLCDHLAPDLRSARRSAGERA